MVGLEKALRWPTKLNLIPNDYHGRVFESAACQTLLKEYEKLNDPEIYSGVDRMRLLLFINFFRFMDQLVPACFATRKVTEDINFALKDLKVNFQATKVSETLQIHVLFEHIPKCIEFLNHHG